MCRLPSCNVEKSIHICVFREDQVENKDDTHFIFNMDNGKSLGFKTEEHIKYEDVVSGGYPITMIVRITEGPSAIIETPMVIFKNRNRFYPIRGIHDDVPGVCYRTGPKDWMDKTVFKEWVSEPRAIKALPSDRQRILFVDNYRAHKVHKNTNSRHQNIRTTLQKFLQNSTHLIQPADKFVIQKIKCPW